MSVVPAVGQKWRPEVGGHPLVIVKIEGAVATVKRADEPKKNLRNPHGGQLTTLKELAAGKLLDEGPVF